MPKSRATIYYAHAMCMYGHPLEALELTFIRASFPRHRVVNPGTYDDSPEKRSDVLEFCFRLIDGADGLVFSRLLGKITAGVGAEVNYALRAGKEVFELVRSANDWSLDRRLRAVRHLDRPATIRLYRQFDGR